MEPPLTHRITRRDAELALERARADADWLASLRAAYRGRHDALDALWWLAHPQTATPGGHADPAAGLAELQRAVFSRAAAESPVTELIEPDTGGVLRMREAEHRLWHLQRLLAEDERCLEHAWRAVHPAAAVSLEAADRPRPPLLIERESHDPHALGEQAETAADEESGSEVPREPHAAPRRKLLIPVAAGVALLAAILVLPALPGITADVNSGQTPAPSVTTPSTTPHARTEIVTIASDGNVSDPLMVLARQQAETDQPGIELGEPFQAGSFRKLPDLVGYLELYLARGDEADSICLVAVRHDDTAVGSCVPEHVYTADGIYVAGSGGYAVSVTMTVLSESFSLRSNGDFHYEATAKAPPVDGTGDVVFPSSAEQFLGS